MRSAALLLGLMMVAMPLSPALGSTLGPSVREGVSFNDSIPETFEANLETIHPGTTFDLHRPSNASEAASSEGPSDDPDPGQGKVELCRSAEVPSLDDCAEWVDRLLGDEVETVSAVAASPDGEIVAVTGYGPRTDDGYGYDYVTTAYDAKSGERLWMETADGPLNFDEALDVEVGPNHTVYVTGRSAGSEKQQGSFIYVKFDWLTIAYDGDAGTEHWRHRLDGPAEANDQALDVELAPDGGTVYTAGYQFDGSGPFDTGYDAVVLALNASTGSLEWKNVYNGPSHDLDWYLALEVGPNGDHVFTTGASYGTPVKEHRSDVLAVAYDGESGEERWVARYDGPKDGQHEYAYLLDVSPGGRALYLGGISQGESGNQLDSLYLAVDPTDGSIRWAERYAGDTNSTEDVAATWHLSFPVGLTVDSSGSRLLVTSNAVAGAGGAVLASGPVTFALSPEGERAWTETYRLTEDQDAVARDVVMEASGDTIYVVGDSASSAQRDLFVVGYRVDDGQMVFRREVGGSAEESLRGTDAVLVDDGSRLVTAGQVSGSAEGVTDHGRIGGPDQITASFDTQPSEALLNPVAPV